jgi:hypothetical protein
MFQNNDRKNQGKTVLSVTNIALEALIGSRSLLLWLLALDWNQGSDPVLRTR